MLESIDPKSTAAWKALAGHYDEIKDAPVRDMFKEDPLRFNDLSIRFEDILFDYSKNIVNKRTMDLLLGLRKDVFRGKDKRHRGQGSTPYRFEEYVRRAGICRRQGCDAGCPEGAG